MATYEIGLTGTARGGIVYLAQRSAGDREYVSVETKSGESAEVVLERLASALNKRHGWDVHPKGNTLSLPRMYVLSGTETGLGIPEPPVSFTVWFDAQQGRLLCYWENPKGRYERIHSPGGWLSPGATQAVVTITGAVDPYATLIAMENFNGKTPSNVALINVSASGNMLEELNSSPFYNGLMPNWICWSTSMNNHAAAKFEQGTKPDVNPTQGVLSPDQKPFYQIVKTRLPDVQAGVYRKFLGLTPGHTYRISGRLNTLEMDASTYDWSFSFHAAYNAPGGADLTVAQLIGSAPLPVGSEGPAAGRIAQYGPGVTTKGKWVKRTSDDSLPGLSIANLTLPSGVDTITVWLRHCGAKSTGVGIDWIKLEDLSYKQKSE